MPSRINLLWSGTMPNKPLKPCSRPGCPNLVSSGLCDDHKRQSNRDYDRGRKDDPGRRLIQSGRWRKIRSRKLSINPLCERCEGNRRLVVAVMVHHKDRNQLNNRDNNLESLCNACHELEHKGERWG